MKLTSLFAKIKTNARGQGSYNDPAPANLLVCLAGFFTHLGFIALFSFLGVTELIYLNILSVGLWAWAIYESANSNTLKATWIGSLEVILHALIATLILGVDAGFQLYLWALCIWMIYAERSSSSFGIVFSLLSIVLLTSIYIFEQYQLLSPLDPVSPAITALLFDANIIATGSLLIFITFFVRRSEEKENKILQSLATHDQLTQLFNRHYFTAFVEQYRRKAIRENEPYCIVLADIDHFKRVNDQHGHVLGDEVLTTLSAYLQQQLRFQDVICRWGGEEFLFLLVNCKLQEAVKRIDTIRVGITKDISIETYTDPIHITVSFGIAESINNEPIEDLISRADGLLYKAKDSGRNAIVAQSQND